VLGVGAAALIAGIATPADRLGRLLTSTRGGGTLAFYEEGLGVTIAVVNQGEGDRAFRRLYIQGTSNSGDAMPSLRYMRLQALLPLIIHTGEPHSALVIGYGTGITAGALLQYPSLDKTVCAELLPEVVNASPLFAGNFHAASDPKLEIRVRDGRRELLRSSERYDLITLEPPPPSAAGVANLYSTDFYRLAGARLQPNGLVAQWLPLTTQNDEDTRPLVRSFLDVFPYATLWSTELHETLLIGSLAPIALDAQAIASRLNQPKVAAALEEVGVNSPAALLATWLTGRDGLKRYAGDAPPVTDDHPRIEYASWVRPGEIKRVLPELLALRTAVPIRGADAALTADIEAQRYSLLEFYEAGISAYNQDRDSWRKEISPALQNNQGDPYYRWVLGDGR
jgi:spermidine synthase